MKKRTTLITGLVAFTVFTGAKCGGFRAASSPGASGMSQGGLGGMSDPMPELPPEPTIPPPCTTLLATKTSTDGNLAAADETALDTQKIQAALDNCAPGHSVKLQSDGAKNAFLSGPLQMVSGVTLWIDAKTTLFASRNPRDYDVAKGSPTCGTDAYDSSGGCRSLINVEKVADVGVMGEGIIDGRGGEPMIGGDTTWWDVAQHAKVTDGKHSNPRLIDVKKSQRFTLYQVSLFNSPKFHVVINSQGYVVWGVKVITPSRATNSLGKPLTPKYARNTDGVDPSAASDGVIAYSYISVGDDQVAIKGGNAGPTTNLIIAHNHFGAGHGMSIGSETNGGVNNVRVYDLSIDGSVPNGGEPKSDLNGIRIKSDPSRGGLVTDISYTDVCIRDMWNPILLTPHYSKADGGDIPQYKNIALNNVRSVLSPGSPIEPVVTLMGYDQTHVLDVTLNNVVVEGIEKGKVKSSFANVSMGPGAVNFAVSGEQVNVTKDITDKAPPNPCKDKWVKFPGQ